MILIVHALQEGSSREPPYVGTSPCHQQGNLQPPHWQVISCMHATPGMYACMRAHTCPFNNEHRYPFGAGAL